MAQGEKQPWGLPQATVAGKICLAEMSHLSWLHPFLRSCCSTSWVKKAMDNLSDSEEGSPLPFELDLLCGVPV